MTKILLAFAALILINPFANAKDPADCKPSCYNAGNVEITAGGVARLMELIMEKKKPEVVSKIKGKEYKFTTDFNVCLVDKVPPEQCDQVPIQTQTYETRVQDFDFNVTKVKPADGNKVRASIEVKKLKIKTCMRTVAGRIVAGRQQAPVRGRPETETGELFHGCNMTMELVIPKPPPPRRLPKMDAEFKVGPTGKLEDKDAIASLKDAKLDLGDAQIKMGLDEKSSAEIARLEKAFFGKMTDVFSDGSKKPKSLSDFEKQLQRHYDTDQKSFDELLKDFNDEMKRKRPDLPALFRAELEALTRDLAKASAAQKMNVMKKFYMKYPQIDEFATFNASKTVLKKEVAKATGFCSDKQESGYDKCYADYLSFKKAAELGNSSLNGDFMKIAQELVNQNMKEIRESVNDALKEVSRDAKKIANPKIPLISVQDIVDSAKQRTATDQMRRQLTRGPASVRTTLSRGNLDNYFRTYDGAKGSSSLDNLDDFEKAVKQMQRPGLSAEDQERISDALDRVEQTKQRIKKQTQGSAMHFHVEAMLDQIRASNAGIKAPLRSNELDCAPTPLLSGPEGGKHHVSTEVSFDAINAYFAKVHKTGGFNMCIKESGVCGKDSSFGSDNAVTSTMDRAPKISADSKGNLQVELGNIKFMDRTMGGIPLFTFGGKSGEIKPQTISVQAKECQGGLICLKPTLHDPKVTGVMHGLSSFFMDFNKMAAKEISSMVSTQSQAMKGISVIPGFKAAGDPKVARGNALRINWNINHINLD